ncbi:MAG TPA: (2Fe-2S)-binding protein [Thermomicrobiales bacterium]|nr:(2Fe-2S)-binding protein [Thermomicrobiales bacterium]
MTDQPCYTCRCERVLAEAVASAIADGNTTVNDVKRRTRAGMGLCQGIYCTAAIAEQLISAGIKPMSIEPMTQRIPVRVINLATVASDPERP